jgi:hypothetical protein
MVAAQDAPGGLTTGGNNNKLIFQFNGSTDANEGYTPWGHATHDLGMAFDLGFTGNYITGDNLTSLNDGGTDLSAQLPTVPAGWGVQQAIDWSKLLPDGPHGAGRDDQVSALRTFLSLYAVTQKGSDGKWGTSGGRCASEAIVSGQSSGSGANGCSCAVG